MPKKQPSTVTGFMFLRYGVTVGGHYFTEPANFFLNEVLT